MMGFWEWRFFVAPAGEIVENTLQIVAPSHGPDFSNSQLKTWLSHS